MEKLNGDILAKMLKEWNQIITRQVKIFIVPSFRRQSGRDLGTLVCAPPEMKCEISLNSNLAMVPFQKAF